MWVAHMISSLDNHFTAKVCELVRGRGDLCKWSLVVRQLRFAKRCSCNVRLSGRQAGQQDAHCTWHALFM